MKKIFILTILLLISISSFAKTDYTTKIFDYDYIIVFNAIVEVLVDKKFNIKTMDRESGLIVTEYRSPKSDNIISQALLGSIFGSTTLNSKVEVIVLKIGDNKTKVILTLSLIDGNPALGHYDDMSVTIGKKEYRNFFKVVEKKIEENF